VSFVLDSLWLFLPGVVVAVQKNSPTWANSSATATADLSKKEDRR
jgi:hypothetical protein